MKTNKKKTPEKGQEEPQCRVTTYKGKVMKKDVITDQEANRLKPAGFNLFIDRVHMKVSIEADDGKPLEVDQNLNGVKGQPLSVLLKLLRHPNRYMPPHEIGKIPPHNDSHYINENIIQYVAKLRKNLFNEDADNANFILTHTNPYRVAFNGELSFCLIESVSD